MIKYGYTIQYVLDVPSTVSFYIKAFGFEKTFITPENDYAELATGETTLAFASFGLGDTNIKAGYLKSSLENRPFGVEFVFVVDNVQSTVDIARSSGAVLEEAPNEKPWGQTVAYVRDINGFLIEVCTAIKSEG
jgi:lactoylglutathione lyase